MSAEEIIQPRNYDLVRCGKELHLKEAYDGISCWTHAEVARRLNLSAARIFALVKEGKLSTIDIRGRRYVTDRSVRAYEEGAVSRRLGIDRRVKA